MPSTNTRKKSKAAQDRVRAKYIIAKDDCHPFHLFPPIKNATEELRKLMGPRMYINVMTEIDKCKYILMKYWWFCEPDLWMCGDGIVFNQNPDKKILIKTMCTKRKQYCLVDHEETLEFISCCPKCRKLAIMIKDTAFECKSCKFQLSHELVNDMPFIKTKCDTCPTMIGWEKAEKISDLLIESLQVRSHIRDKHEKTLVDQKLKELSKDE